MNIEKKRRDVPLKANKPRKSIKTQRYVKLNEASIPMAVHNAKLDPYHYTVLAKLCLYADFKTGEAFPAKEQLAADCFCSKSKLCLVIAELVKLGWIEMLEVGGGKRSSIYKIQAVVDHHQARKNRKDNRSITTVDVATSPEPNRDNIDSAVLTETQTWEVEGKHYNYLELIDREILIAGNSIRNKNGYRDMAIRKCHIGIVCGHEVLHGNRVGAFGITPKKPSPINPRSLTRYYG